jgi:hypothetical protein
MVTLPTAYGRRWRPDNPEVRFLATNKKTTVCAVIIMPVVWFEFNGKIVYDARRTGSGSVKLL